MDTGIIAVLLNNGSLVMMGLMLLVFITTAIVQTLKGVFKKLPTNLLVFIVSISVTVLAVFSVLAVYEIAFEWYYLTSAIVLGFLVAYAAMYGFEKFKDLYDRFKNLKDSR